jgi:hypothetical protein
LPLLVATGAGNGVVRLWNAEYGQAVYHFNPQKASGASVNALGFSADGYLMSVSSHNEVIVWNLFPLLSPRKKSKEPEPEPETGGLPPQPIPQQFQQPGQQQAPREPFPAFQDGLGTDPVKLGIITGRGQRVFLSGTEGVRVTVGSRVLSSQYATDTTDELAGAFTPWAVDAITDPSSGLVAFYGSYRELDKTEHPVLVLMGVGDAKVLGKGSVRGRVLGRPATVSFAPDGKWLVVCNGEEVMYWPVPGSQVVEGAPKLLPNAPAYVAAAGPNGLVALASPPEDGKGVTVTVADVSGAQPKVLAVYATDITRVSALAFSPDGSRLAVGDDREGVVQIWKRD